MARSGTTCRRLIVALSCALAGSGLPTLAGQNQVADDGQPTVTVPFELMPSLHMAVQVKLNGSGPFRLIFDLGSPVVVVSGRAAAAAGLISQESAKLPTLFGMRGQGNIKKFQIGRLVAKDVPVIIMDHPAIEQARPVLGQIDGIVGYSFFARYRFTLDYARQQLRFQPTGRRPEDVMTRMFVRLFGARTVRPVAAAGLWGIQVARSGDGGQEGVEIGRVWPGSAAEEAGIRAGDRLLSIDGRWTDSLEDAVYAASFVTPGQKAQVVVLRDGRRLRLTVQPRTGL